MGLLAATDAIIPVEPRYLETVGLLSVIGKINEIREGWRHQQLRVRGILVTKMDRRVRGHSQLLEELQAHNALGSLVCGVIPRMRRSPIHITITSASSTTTRKRQRAKPMGWWSPTSCASSTAERRRSDGAQA